LHNPGDHLIIDCLFLSAILVIFGVFIYTVGYVYFTLGSFKASKVIHSTLLDSVFGTTFRWLDVTPTSRIIARCTADINAVDDSLSEAVWNFLSDESFYMAPFKLTGHPFRYHPHNGGQFFCCHIFHASVHSTRIPGDIFGDLVWEDLFGLAT
jgi:hypothetical protein